jgi:hypothetical protein
VEQSPPLAFSGITPWHFAKLTAKAQAAGINLSGNRGRASKFGVEIEWNYSAETGELTLHCLDLPPFVKPEAVNAKILALVKESEG